MGNKLIFSCFDEFAADFERTVKPEFGHPERCRQEMVDTDMNDLTCNGTYSFIFLDEECKDGHSHNFVFDILMDYDTCDTVAIYKGMY